MRVYAGEVESLSDAGGRGVGVRAFAGTRSGYAYGTDLSEDGVAEVARAAREAAEVADEDEFEGLPDELGTLGRGRPCLARAGRLVHRAQSWSSRSRWSARPARVRA